MKHKISTPQLIEELTQLEEEAMRFAGRCRAAKENLSRQSLAAASTPARGHLTNADREALRLNLRKNLNARMMHKTHGGG